MGAVCLTLSLLCLGLNVVRWQWLVAADAHARYEFACGEDDRLGLRVTAALQVRYERRLYQYAEVVRLRARTLHDPAWMIHGCV